MVAALSGLATGVALANILGIDRTEELITEVKESVDDFKEEFESSPPNNMKELLKERSVH